MSKSKQLLLEAIRACADSLGIEFDSYEDGTETSLDFPDHLALLQAISLIDAAIAANMPPRVGLRFRISAYNVPAHLKEEVESLYMSYVPHDDLIVEESDSGWDIWTDRWAQTPKKALSMIKDFKDCIFTGPVGLSIYVDVDF